MLLNRIQIDSPKAIEHYNQGLRIREWDKAAGNKPAHNLCFEEGMDHYILKPSQAEELIGRIYEA
ncbi:hypothetical protein N9933_02040 [bacterium]|nr:hypothetical protein [bacterium]